MNSVYVSLQNSINSDGLWYPSISIYYSGCDKKTKCVNCHNPELQKRNVGYKISSIKLIKHIENMLVNWLNTFPKISICYLGGEPLTIWNRKSVLEISKYFKQNYNENIYNIFYSWRYLEDIKNENLSSYIKYMDYGVLGDFQEDKKDIKYIPSSFNQYIYDFNNNKKIKAIKKG